MPRFSFRFVAVLGLLGRSSLEMSGIDRFRTFLMDARSTERRPPGRTTRRENTRSGIFDSLIFFIVERFNLFLRHPLTRTLAERTPSHILRISRTFLLVFALVLSACTKKQPESAPEERSVTLRIVHDPELSVYLDKMRTGFLSQAGKLSDGTKIKIELIAQESLEASRIIADGSLKSDAWLAPSASLVNLTNAHLTNLGPRQIECTPLFASPIVLATQEKNGTLVHASGGTFAWNEFFEEQIGTPAQAVENARYVGLAHGAPSKSIVGLSSLIQLAYLASYNKEAFINSESISAPRSLELLTRYEGMISFYGNDEARMLARVADPENKRALFALTSEQQVARYNQNAIDSKSLVALYPSEGSFWLDYNFCISDADWVTSAVKASLKAFVGYLSTKEAQYEIKLAGYRPSVVALGDVPPLTAKFGVNTTLPSNSLLPVSAAVIDQLKAKWSDVRRPLALMVVFDTSGSMDGPALTLGQSTTRKFLAALPSSDVAGLISFTSEVSIQSEPIHNSKQLFSKVDSLRSLGGSALYDAIKLGTETLSKDEFANYRKLILVYTDGDDKNSQVSLNRLTELLRERAPELDLQANIICLKKTDALCANLDKLAEITGGIYREAEPAQVEGVFDSIVAGL